MTDQCMPKLFEGLAPEVLDYINTLRGENYTLKEDLGVIKDRHNRACAVLGGLKEENLVGNMEYVQNGIDTAKAILGNEDVATAREEMAKLKEAWQLISDLHLKAQREIYCVESDYKAGLMTLDEVWERVNRARGILGGDNV